MENNNLKEEVKGLKALKDDLERMKFVNLELREKIDEVKQNVVKTLNTGKVLPKSPGTAVLDENELKMKHRMDLESMKKLDFF